MVEFQKYSYKKIAKHTIYAFFNLYWNYNKKRTKINNKRPGLAHFKKISPKFPVDPGIWNLANNPVLSKHILFKKWANPDLFFIYFVFSNTHYKFYNK